MHDRAKKIKLYDTLQGEKVLFVPREDNKVYMYVCGLTPSNYPHIGHARTAVIFDVIQRIFMHFGYEVHYCSNFTDIDDKIIARAKEENISPKELAEKYIEAYLESMKELHVKVPSCFARVTQHIPEIIEIVQTLIDKEYAYASGGDVYFRVRSFRSYGKLSKRSIKELLVGARIEPDEKKQDPLDFALWKSAKPGEPYWESPWGKGRPGWHIECSAMSLKYLNNSFDIHGGAQDLIFPHHENEIAQAEAYSGIEPFSRYWLHAGWVTLNKEKMSKSVGNVFRLSEALSLVHANVLRLFFISTLYSSPLDYDIKNLHQAGKTLERIVLTIKRLHLQAKKGVHNKPRTENNVFMEELKADFDQALSDNFNTPQAIAVIMLAVKEANRLMDEGNLGETHAHEIWKALTDWLILLGFHEVEHTSFSRFSNTELVERVSELFIAYKISLPSTMDIVSLVNELIELRKTSRMQKNFALADQIRKDLSEMNIYLEDSIEGTSFRISEDLS